MLTKKELTKMNSRILQAKDIVFYGYRIEDEAGRYVNFEKIISGGQTGGDMGGLLAGKFLEMKTGGVCPANWRTELGETPALKKYGLICHESDKYPPRTKLNVRAGDATLLVGRDNSPGMKLTKNTCETLDKPFFHVNYPNAVLMNFLYTNLATWLIDHNIKVLNVAGNRESTNNGIEKFTKNMIVTLIKKYGTPYPLGEYKV